MSGWSGRSNKPTLRPILQQRGSQQCGSAAASVASPRSGLGDSQACLTNSVRGVSGEFQLSLGSLRKGHGPLLKPVYQNLSLECPNISQGDHSMSQKCEGNTLKPVRKWGNLKNSVTGLCT